jgi:FlaA1/EpsC-like NDP-sugar epimerase
MRVRYLLLLDAIAIVAAIWAAFAFRFGWFFLTAHPEFLLLAAGAVLLKVATFVMFGVYQRYWRYATFADLMTFVLANVAGSVLLGVFAVGLRLFDLIPGLSRTIPPLDLLFAITFTVGLRASVRAVGEARLAAGYRTQTKKRRVLVVGAGDAGTLVVREMQRNPQLSLEPVGYLDDDPEKRGKRIYGINVLGVLTDLGAVAAHYRIDEVVIALPTAGGSTVRALTERCREAKVAYRAIPGVFELLDGQVSVSRLRNVEIGDLLRRPQRQPSSSLSTYLKNACVLVTGAGGSIGSELCRQIAAAGPARLVLLGHGENSVFDIAAELRQRHPGLALQAVIADVRDGRRIDRLFREIEPTAVFHAAAHKHVPLMEDNPVEAITNNVGGTRNVVDAAAAVGVQQFVMVSTDKAAAPSNMMGASKRLAELIVQQAAAAHQKPYTVVRFGNVLGSRGSVVPIFKKQIEQGGPITVTHPDVRRYFMTIPEAVHLILEAGGLACGGELFVLDMGEPVRLRDMAADMIRLSGLTEQDVPITFTGLRPGEKLDEILWEGDAMVEASGRTGIRRVREPRVVASEDLMPVIDGLMAAAERHDVQRLYSLIRSTLPQSTLQVSAGATGASRAATIVPLPTRQG